MSNRIDSDHHTSRLYASMETPQSIFQWPVKERSTPYLECDRSYRTQRYSDLLIGRDGTVRKTFSATMSLNLKRVMCNLPQRVYSKLVALEWSEFRGRIERMRTELTEAGHQGRDVSSLLLVERHTQTSADLRLTIVYMRPDLYKCDALCRLNSTGNRNRSW